MEATPSSNFDFRGFEPKARGHSSPNALALGHASLLAYSDADVIERTVTGRWGMKDFTFFTATDSLVDTQAYLMGSNDALILAFRGTGTNPKDLFTDADAVLAGGPGGKVHDGFQHALMIVWKQVVTELRRQREGGSRPLWITGHSLGAALATLAVAKLRLDRDEPVDGLYTYGSPRVGDRDFQRTFDADFEHQAFRYVNSTDIVTRFFTRLSGYSHIGTFKYFDGSGKLTNLPWFEVLADRCRRDIADAIDAITGVDKDLPGLKEHQLLGPMGYLARLERAASGY